MVETTQANPPERAKRRKTRCMFKDGRGRWWLDYYTPDGKRRRKLCGSFDEAKIALAEINLSRKRDTYIDPHAAPTFLEYSKKYLDTVSVHKDSHEGETRLMKNLTAFFGSSRLSKIKRARV